MADRLAGKNGPTDSGHPFAIAPNDGADLLSVTRLLIVGGAGTVHFIDGNGREDTINLLEGQYPFRLKKIFNSGTTATSLVGVE